MTIQMFQIEYLSSQDGISEKEIKDALTSCDKCAKYHFSEITVKEIIDE